MNLRPQLPMSHSLYILSKTPVAKTNIFESPYRVHLLCVIRVQKYHFSEQSPNSWFHHPSESSMATLQVHGASRTLLSFPIPEDHRVDLPRNKCPAGDNTHGAPRVAPKNCPPKNKPTIPDKLPLSAKSFASIRVTQSPPQTSNSQSFLGRAFWQPIARSFSLSDSSKVPSKKVSENCSLMQRRLD